MKLFISYSRDDKAWVRELWRALRDRTHHDVWIDQQLVPAQDWWETILKNIEICECCIYVMTPKSVESIYCAAELNYALALNKPVIPLMLESCDPPAEIRKRRIQYSTISDSDSLGDVLLTIERALGEVRVGLLQGKYPSPQPIPSRPDEPTPDKKSEHISEEIVKPAAPAVIKQPSILDILSRPFAWIEIPDGRVKLGTLRAGGPISKPTEFNVSAFAVAKFPITNAQFAKFIEADGYEQKKWWTDAGWEAREKGWAWDEDRVCKPTDKPWIEPRYWQDKKWNGAEYPVVGVSWYECLAFCHWLSDITGNKIMLPTEQQWQRAAQADTNWAYPWGPDFETSRCNASVGQNWRENSTSYVTRYEGRGESPFGVVDMSGNVCEWCLTEYESGNVEINKVTKRVLRGGSWDSITPNSLRVDYCESDDPHIGKSSRGFRIVRSS